MILADTAKCGNPPPVDPGPSSVPPYTAVQKRSFRRACKRAISYGETKYRGHLVRIQDFPVSLVQHLQKQFSAGSPRPVRPQMQRKDPRRLNIMHWNPGGLSQSSYFELKHWLKTQPIDIVTIAETRWGFTRCWQDTDWACVHSSGSEPRAGGVLVMISRRLVHPDAIGFEEVVPGRVLHVRAHFQQRALDLFAVYQHVHNRSADNLRKRQSVWQELDNALGAVPHRNQLLCTGDFDCSLHKVSESVGCANYPWHQTQQTGPAHPDMDRLAQLISAHMLTALNTWPGYTGPTYVHGEVTSRIDFIFARTAHCDGRAKQVCYLDDADFLPHNTTHHIPMICSIKRNHLNYKSHSLHRTCTYNQRSQCRQAKMQDSSTWHQLQQVVTTAIHQVPMQNTEDPITNLHNQVLPHFQNIFPPTPTRLTPPHLDPVRPTIMLKWYHRQQIRLIRSSTMPIMGSCPQLLHIALQVWYHQVRSAVCQRWQQKQLRQAKRHRFDDLCKEVAHASRLHDSHAMFRIINAFSPKRPLARTRLRTSTGQIASQSDSHAILVEYVTRTWRGPDHLTLTSEHAPGIPFSRAALEQAIENLHPNKSVALPFLPAIVWKSNPVAVADFIYGLLQQWWTQSPPYIPPAWKNAWIFFLPKPGKPCTAPEQLRPISLMEPLGKLVMGLLAGLMKQQLAPRFCQDPHFGISAISSCSGRHCQGFSTLPNSPGHGGPTAPHCHAANHPGSQVSFLWRTPTLLGSEQSF